MSIYDAKTGEAVRKWRTRHGLRQTDLAAELGVRLNTVSRWELGQSPAPAYLSLALAELERVLDDRAFEERRRERINGDTRKAFRERHAKRN